MFSYYVTADKSQGNRDFQSRRQVKARIHSLFPFPSLAFHQVKFEISVIIEWDESEYAPAEQDSIMGEAITTLGTQDGPAPYTLSYNSESYGPLTYAPLFISHSLLPSQLKILRRFSKVTATFDPPVELESSKTYMFAMYYVAASSDDWYLIAATV
jgi:hypothetical protein